MHTRHIWASLARAPVARRASGACVGALSAFAALALITSFARAEEVAPEARASYDKAGIAREEGRLEKAAELYRKAIDAAPLYLKAHAGYMGSLRALGDTFTAQEMYAGLVAKHPDSVDLKAFAASAQEPKAAIEALEALSKEHGDNVRVGIELGRVYLTSGDPKKGERPLKSVLKLDPENVTARILLGDCELAQDNPKTALKEYESALEVDADSVPARLRLALALHRNEKSTQALETLGKLVSDNAYPNLVAGHWLLAKIRLDLGKPDDALKSIDKVLEIDKDDFDAMIAKGHLLLKAEKPGEAAKIFAKAAEKNPRSGEALFALGWSQEMAAAASGVDDAKSKELLAAAAAAYEKCTSVDPGVRPRDSLGFVHLLRNEHAEAVTQFKRAADINPEFAAAVNNLGLASDLADNRAAAKKRYEEVLRKIEKKNVRAMVMLALDHWLDGASSKALKGLQKALKIDPDDDLAWTFLGDIQADRQKWNDAIKSYTRAVELNPTNFIAWYHMGQLYQDAKRKWEEADRCFRKALEAKATPPHELLLRLAEVNEEEALDNLEDALKFYKQYKEAGGSTEPPWDWIDARIEELEEAAAKGK